MTDEPYTMSDAELVATFRDSPNFDSWVCRLAGRRIEALTSELRIMTKERDAFVATLDPEGHNVVMAMTRARDTATLTTKLAEAEAALAQARTTAQYWKDEHLAANVKLAELSAQRDAAYGYGKDGGEPPWMK